MNKKLYLLCVMSLSMMAFNVVASSAYMAPSAAWGQRLLATLKAGKSWASVKPILCELSSLSSCPRKYLLSSAPLAAALQEAYTEEGSSDKILPLQYGILYAPADVAKELLRLGATAPSCDVERWVSARYASQVMYLFIGVDIVKAYNRYVVGVIE